MSKTKVLIVDDSNLIKEILSSILNSDPEIEVIGTASDPYEAREKIKLLNPDVITLDIEMPKMNGLDFLEKIMNLRPTPVIMVSSLTEKGAVKTIRALELGAIDYVFKPTSRVEESLNELKYEIINKVKVAASARVRSFFSETISRKIIRHNLNFKDKIIAIGSSTGGVEAIKEIITLLPANFPPVIIVQHMLPAFTALLSNRLNEISSMKVSEAKDMEELKKGNVYIAPGNIHIEVVKKNNKFYIAHNNSDPVSGHRPSVDVLFYSVAKNIGSDAIGVILTGMGKDGASGMLEMKEAGSYNIGQDASTCVVYGMPKAAKQNNAIDIELPIKKIAEILINRCQ